MRFTLLKDLNKDKHMRPIMLGFLSFTLLYLFADIFMQHLSFGVFPKTLMQTLYGNEEAFIDPISEGSFLEFWHSEIFFTMMIVFTLSTLCIRLCKASRVSLVGVNLMLISSLVTLSILPLSFYLSKDLLFVYSASFLLWHFIAICAAIFSFKRLYFA